jgi:hypothetical protein
MAKYSVNAAVVGSKHLGVYEAKNEDEAIEKAMKENGSVGMCHQCSSECEDPEINDVTAELIDN